MAVVAVAFSVREATIAAQGAGAAAVVAAAAVFALVAATAERAAASAASVPTGQGHLQGWW